MKYIVIIPARNEETLIAGVLDSLASQTIVPAQCVVINDGSTDRTGTIAETWAAKCAWLSVLHRSNRGFRSSGVGVMETCAVGLEAISEKDWDFLVKLDADLTFHPTYFEECFDEFARQPRLGIGGGTICVRDHAGIRVEFPDDPLFHVRGATKIYRRACWEQIGGMVQSTGWDTIDELKANQLGWHTRTFPHIRLLQHRETGRAELRWKDYCKNGRANYMAGYHPLFMLMKCARRLFSRPPLIMALGLAVGFLDAWRKGLPRPVDDQFIAYVRRQQINRLRGRPSIWGP